MSQSKNRPYTFPQSRAGLRAPENPEMGGRLQPSGGAPGLPILIRRGRGARVITIEGSILHDFWLAGGRYPFGHAPAFLTRAEKNAVSLGDMAGYPQNAHIRLLNRLARLLPGYRVCFTPPGFEVPVGAKVLDLRRTAFCAPMDAGLRAAAAGEAGCAAGLSEEITCCNYQTAAAAPASAAPVFAAPEPAVPAAIRSGENAARPDIILINGALFVDILAIRGDCAPGGYAQCAGYAEYEIYPDAISAARANALLRRLQSPDEPYTKIASLAALFRRRAGDLLIGNAADSGCLRVAMNVAKRDALLREGFLLSPDGVIYFCSEHDPRTVARLADALSKADGANAADDTSQYTTV